MASEPDVKMDYNRVGRDQGQKSKIHDSGDRTPDGGYKIKTYYPTKEQMKDFSAYMRYVHEDGGHKAGLAKIVPPSDYKPRKSGYDDEELYNMEITCPIKQEVTGEGGLYQQLNLVEKKKMLVRNFKKLAETKHPTPVHTTEAEIDRIFWKNIFTNPSIYGADVPGTLYDDDCDEFNLTRLNTILDNIQDDYGVTIQGVNTTYLYFGMWKSSFCWHTEDMDLYSINYLHTGQPKSWYCIAPEYGKRFERLAASFFPHSFRTCRAFLRHKTTLISPQILRKYSIPFSRCTQQRGEFMVTFPYSYHSGYNHGFNIAEATNFALEYWIDFGKWATRCECSSESVKISMQTFVKRYQADRYENWIQGKDICKDPRDPKHIAAAPKPTEYDLYLMGAHERREDETIEEIEESKQKNALQQNQSSNVKAKTKRSKKTFDSFEETYQRYNEYMMAHDSNQNRLDHHPMQFPSYSPIPTTMVEMSQHMSIGNQELPTVILNREKPAYDQLVRKQVKKMKLKEERSRLKKEKKAKERIVSSKELLQFLPLTFTHEKRFNRCIAAQVPHCSVCQLLVCHPKDNENIWGPKAAAEPQQSQETQSGDNNLETNVFDTSSPVTPQPTIAGPQVEEFKLPESSRVLLPRGLFNRNPELTKCEYFGEKDMKPDPDTSDKQECDANATQQQTEPRESDSGYEEKLEFLDLNLESSELLQCAVCMLSVHKLCYGIDKLPENKKDWICDRCIESNRSLINCALCPCRGGALKAISEVWVHITCALSVPDINFIDLIRPDSSTISKVRLPDPPERNSCVYCAKNMNLARYVQGRCITCIGHWGSNGEQVECHNTFHTTCGHRNGAKFDYFDLHIDPQQTNPIRATCSDCFSKSNMMDLETYELSQMSNVSDLEPIEIGTQVIARSQDTSYKEGTIEAHVIFNTYDIFYPGLSEVELNISERRILNLDDTKELKVGDPLIVRGYKEKERCGKFKAKRVREEYQVRFLKTQQVEKVARQDIYLNVDQMPEEILEMYLRENERFAVTSTDI